MKKILLLSFVLSSFSFSFTSISDKEIDAEYKKWSEANKKRIEIELKKQKSINLPRNSVVNQPALDNTPKNKKLQEFNSVNLPKNFTLKQGTCIVKNQLDKSILLNGNCSLLIHKTYPQQYIYSFKNSRDFFFQKNKSFWVLKQENIEDKKAEFNSTNNSFNTDLYKVEFK